MKCRDCNKGKIRFLADTVDKKRIYEEVDCGTCGGTGELPEVVFKPEKVERRKLRLTRRQIVEDLERDAEEDIYREDYLEQRNDCYSYYGGR